MFSPHKFIRQATALAALALLFFPSLALPGSFVQSSVTARYSLNDWAAGAGWHDELLVQEDRGTGLSDVYYTNGETRVAVGSLVQANASGIQPLFLEIPSGERFIIGRVDAGSHFKEVRICAGSSAELICKTVPVRDGYFLAAVTRDQPAWENIAAIQAMTAGAVGSDAYAGRNGYLVSYDLPQNVEYIRITIK